MRRSTCAHTRSSSNAGISATRNIRSTTSLTSPSLPASSSPFNTRHTFRNNSSLFSFFLSILFRIF